MLLNAPKALFLGLFAPLIGWFNIFWLVSVAENYLLLGMSILALIWTFKKKIRLTRLAILSIIFVAVMSTLLAMTAPNIGTLVRYKTGFLPVFLLLIGGGLNQISWIKSVSARLL